MEVVYLHADILASVQSDHNKNSHIISIRLPTLKMWHKDDFILQGNNNQENIIPRLFILSHSDL